MSPCYTSSILHPRNFIQVGNPSSSTCTHLHGHCSPVTKLFWPLGVTQPDTETTVITAFVLKLNEPPLVFAKAAQNWARCASALVTPHWGTGTRIKFKSTEKYPATVKGTHFVNPNSCFFIFWQRARTGENLKNEALFWTQKLPLRTHFHN